MSKRLKKFLMVYVPFIAMIFAGAVVICALVDNRTLNFALGAAWGGFCGICTALWSIHLDKSNIL